MTRFLTRLVLLLVATVLVATSFPAGAGAAALRVGTDVSYAPLEFYVAGSRTARGFDVDLMQAIAQHMGRTLDLRNHSFDTLLSAVSMGSLDLGISSISDTRAREKTMDFVDYLQVGTGMLVPRGNPHHVMNLGGLCGLRVDVQGGTSSETDLKAQSASCTAIGLGPVHIEAYTTDEQASDAFKAGKSDVHLADYPVVAYLAERSGGKYEVAGRQFDVIPYGIAVAKSQGALLKAVQNALLATISDGTYDALVKKWNLGQAAMRGAPINAGRLY